jgi:hypothetical protein
MNAWRKHYGRRCLIERRACGGDETLEVCAIQSDEHPWIGAK